MSNRLTALEIFNNNDSIEKNGIKLREIAYTTKINLRINPKNKSLISELRQVLNVLLPNQANTFSQYEHIKAIWLGPNEWLITEDTENNNTRLLKVINDIVGSIDGSVTDISEQRTILHLEGEKINLLLSKFLTLDLDNIFNKPRRAAQTLFVKVPILICKANNDFNSNIFDIFVNRSQAKYIYDLLIDGSQNLEI
tara:strand:+ start:370 stop:957 length:588 start_codon:yes stop_codon:yes gene_type:complete